MRRIIFSAIVLLFSRCLFAQPINPRPSLTDQDYLQKSKKQKKTALILLGGGTGLIITSIVIPRGALTEDGICFAGYCDDEYKNDDLKTTLFIAGGVAALGSIPFFIASRKNRRRAAAISFKMENTIQLNNRDLASASFPALRIKLGF